VNTGRSPNIGKYKRFLEPTKVHVKGTKQIIVAEPRWPAVVALLAVGGLHFSLPESLTMGPDWLLLVLVSVLLVPTILARQLGFLRVSQVFGYIVSGVVTLDLIWSLALLVRSLPKHQLPPEQLLVSATCLWVTNILVFALWYWRLDAGGPHARDQRATHKEGGFLFPQMLTPDREERWSPGFVDYLFLAFNTSTAFSPTDVPVLSRWAKLLTMVQSIISLATVVLLAARAVNIL
jgi:uncharacterized membrane protein